MKKVRADGGGVPADDEEILEVEAVKGKVEEGEGLPKWFGKLEGDLLKGMDAIVERKMVPLKTDIEDVKKKVEEANDKAAEGNHCYRSEGHDSGIERGFEQIGFEFISNRR